MGTIVDRQNEADLLPIDHYRSYLLLLAHAQIGRRVRTKVDASDVVQQTLLRAHQARDEFKGRESAELVGWLRRILARTIANAIRDLHRAKRNLAMERSLEAEVEESSSRLACWLADPRSGPGSRVAHAEQLVLIADALIALPEAQREAIVLKHCRGMGLAEVAEQMGRSHASVASLLRRGLQQLREKLNGAGESPKQILE